MTHYDLFVIGGGSGGVASARASAAHGAKVGIAEGDAFGGTCVNRGCVPKKFYVYASHFPDEVRAMTHYGWQTSEPSFDWDTLKRAVFEEVARLNGIYDSMLNKAGVTVYPKRATLEDAHTIRIGDETITADKIMIATGGKPFVPAIEGSEHGITSDDAFHLETLPKRIVIIGGGYIAVEFAGIFHGLGVEVHQMVRGDGILRGFDGDVRALVQEKMQQKGIHIHCQTSVTAIVKEANGSLTLSLDNGEKMATDVLMFATGRVPNTESLGLEAAGVACDDKHEIIVDEWQQTSIENIYAVGDVTGRGLDLTPVAINQGRAFADSHFGNSRRNIEDMVIPTAVFSQPPIGTVGLTEEEATEQYAKVDIYRSQFRPMKYSLAKSEDQVLMKLVVDGDSGKVLGAHMVGEDAAEIMQGVAVAIRAGATKTDFDRTVGIHPSSAEEFVTMREKSHTHTNDRRQAC